MDDRTADATGDPSPGDPVGTFGEEALKLLAAAQAWAGEQQEAADGHGEDTAGPCPTCGSNPRVVPCTWCPICQAAGLLRAASPEIGVALRSSVASLTDLARTVLEALAEHQQHDRPTHDDRRADRPADDPAGVGVEHIDLADDGGDDTWD